MAYYNCKVRVMRDGKESNLVETNSVDLVPGDIIETPENCSMPCDIALLSGTCIVNESMLTGESIPVIKNPVPRIKDIYNAEQDQKYTLYGGTKVI
jgi:cation-transporting P-type ATPase 13A2